MAKTIKAKPPAPPAPAVPDTVKDDGLSRYSITAGPLSATIRAADSKAAWAQFIRGNKSLERHPKQYATADNPSGRTIKQV